MHCMGIPSQRNFRFCLDGTGSPARGNFLFGNHRFAFVSTLCPRRFSTPLTPPPLRNTSLLTNHAGEDESEGSTADTARLKTGETVDRRQNNGSVKAVSPRLGVHCAIAVSTAVLGRDNVRCTAVEEQPEAKEVQLSQSRSTSLFMISSGLT